MIRKLLLLSLGFHAAFGCVWLSFFRHIKYAELYPAMSALLCLIQIGLFFKYLENEYKQALEVNAIRDDLTKARETIIEDFKKFDKENERIRKALFQLGAAIANDSKIVSDLTNTAEERMKTMDRMTMTIAALKEFFEDKKN